MDNHTLSEELGLNAVPPKSAIHVGEKFSSFAKLQRRLEEHKEVTFTEYWIRDNRTLEHATKRVPDRVRCSNRDLKYYYVKFSCIHGGQKLREKPTISARPSRSLKQGCTANIYCTLSDDAQNLIVKSMVNEHNHPLNSRKSLRLFQLRKIKFASEPVCKSSVKKNTKKLTAQELKTGVYYKMADDFQLCVMILEQHGCQVEVLTYDNNELKGIYFQDSVMKDDYDSFPEILFIDGTYKLADLRTSLYLFVVVDSTGNFEIIAVAILYTEDRDSVDWLVNTFKDKNPKWTKTCVIMTDTNPTEREVLRKTFCNARLLICQFHVMQEFKKNITGSALNVTEEEEMQAKEYLQNIMHCKCLDDYDELYDSMKNTLPVQIIKYYDDNWHSIRQEWVLGLLEETGDFLSSTSNRVASVNRRLRSKLVLHRFLKQFVDEFFVDLQKKRIERDQNMIKLLHEVPDETCSDLDVQKYMDLLTPYAFKYFKKQYLLIEKEVSDTDTHCTIAGGTYFLNTSSSEKVVVTPKSCECSFFNCIGLPCRHVLFLRHRLKMDLFDAELCLKRWTKKFSMRPRRGSQPSVTNVVTEEITTPIQEVQENDVFTWSSIPKPSATLSAKEKESIMLLHTNKLSALASNLCDEHYNECLLHVKELVKFCENLDEVDSSELLKDSATLCEEKLSQNTTYITKCEMSETSPRSEMCPSVKNSSHVPMSPTQDPLVIYSGSALETFTESRTRKRSGDLNSALQNQCGLPGRKKAASGLITVPLVSPNQTECATVSVFCTPWMSHGVFENESADGNAGDIEHAMQVNVVSKNSVSPPQ